MDNFFKILILGDIHTGKTRLLENFIGYKLHNSHVIGVERVFKKIQVLNKTITFQITDTGGQERFRRIPEHHYRGVDGILLVYDMSNLKTFDNLDDWLIDIRKFTKNCPIILVANKCCVEIEVNPILANKLAVENDMVIMETSNIYEIFRCLGMMILSEF